MTTNAVSPIDERNERIALIACPVFGAIVAGVLSFMLHTAARVFRVEVDAVQVLIPACCIGVVLGAIGGWRWVRVRRAMREIASSIWCAFFMFGGVVLICVAFALGGDEINGAIPAGIGAVLISIGALVMWLSGLPSRRAKRLLVDGSVARGHIKEVRETSFVMGNQRRHQAVVRFNADDTTQVARCNLYGREAMRARSMAEDKSTVNVLFDPTNPQRVLLPDVLTLTD